MSTQRQADRIAIASMVLVAVAIGTIALAHVNRRQAVVRLGYDLGEATEQLRSLRETNHQLALEKATLCRPERIRPMAQAMGLVQPSPDQVRAVRLGAQVVTLNSNGIAP